jgi:pyruvate,water dikinase
MIKHFSELTPEHYHAAGGKGSMLAKMYKGGYPVPEGFVVLLSAFEGGGLMPQFHDDITGYQTELEQRGNLACI